MLRLTRLRGKLSRLCLGECINSDERLFAVFRAEVADSCVTAPAVAAALHPASEILLSLPLADLALAERLQTILSFSIEVGATGWPEVGG
ncbi:hypothetical protein [Synechococcus sp. CCY9201]|uniref:hypothetical protein n=1 Tax=Synechococcus sp. CCY9201 TaxID=174697 RepID=UPI002B204B6C|nr:hypothetical protein [Synechococcus sp. CCY9201]